MDDQESACRERRCTLSGAIGEPDSFYDDQRRAVSHTKLQSGDDLADRRSESDGDRRRRHRWKLSRWMVDLEYRNDLFGVRLRCQPRGSETAPSSKATLVRNLRMIAWSDRVWLAVGRQRVVLRNALRLSGLGFLTGALRASMIAAVRFPGRFRKSRTRPIRNRTSVRRPKVEQLLSPKCRERCSASILCTAHTPRLHRGRRFCRDDAVTTWRQPGLGLASYIFNSRVPPLSHRV